MKEFLEAGDTKTVESFAAVDQLYEGLGFTLLMGANSKEPAPQGQPFPNERTYPELPPDNRRNHRFGR